MFIFVHRHQFPWWPPFSLFGAEMRCRCAPCRFTLSAVSYGVRIWRIWARDPLPASGFRQHAGLGRRADGHWSRRSHSQAAWKLARGLLKRTDRKQLSQPVGCGSLWLNLTAIFPWTTVNTKNDAMSPFCGNPIFCGKPYVPWPERFGHCAFQVATKQRAL